MLRLRRKRRETIEIIVPPSSGETRVLISVLETHLTNVLVGLDAPEVVKIFRGELKRPESDQSGG